MKLFELSLIALAFTTGMFMRRPVDCLTQEQLDVLDTLEVVYIDDCESGPGFKTLRVKEANLQVVSGLGDTEDTNGLGNLIVGYNEFGNPCVRTGSHNVIVGRGISYSSFGGLFTGSDLVSNDEYQTILSSFETILDADAHHASAISAEFGVIDGESEYSSILSGLSSYISNTDRSAIIGGDFNTMIYGQGYAVTIGGEENSNIGFASVVTGGEDNIAEGTYSVVSGGSARTASGPDDWVAGSLFEDN